MGAGGVGFTGDEGADNQKASHDEMIERNPGRPMACDSERDR